jgi:uncharacterized protein
MGREQNSQQRAGGVDAMLARHGGLSYLEIPASDGQQSARFYEKVLNWRLSDGQDGTWRFADPTGHLIGRLVKGRAVHREPGLMLYIYVDQLREVVKRVEANGGEVVKAPYREGNLWICTVRDPAGNLIGMWEDGEG